MGPFPRHIALSGKYSSEIFTRKAELRHISRLKYWPLKSVLTEKYLIPDEDADTLSSFLVPMLQLDPLKRATAKDMLEEQWLDGVIVQGEEDLMELRRNTSSGRVKELNMEELQVLKPAVISNV
jgi:serine/threonine-protein kinase SRPK3